MDYDKAKDKIVKLMALAKNAGANEGEAENALRQAEALMRKFGIEDAETCLTTAARTFDWGSAFAPYGIPRQPAKEVPKWFSIMSVGVAVFTDTVVKLHRNTEKGMGCGFYGEVGDVAFAVWLITYLRDTVWREANRHPNTDRTARSDFRLNMACTLQARMKTLRAERDAVFKVAGTGTALVVVNKKIEERNAEFGEQKIKNHKISARVGDSFVAGQRAGEKVNFNKPLANQKQQQLG